MEREKEDDKISKMAGMLLAGGRMLSVHCGTCGSPLFEFKGKVVCPVCNEKIELTKAEPELRGAPSSKIERVLRAKLDTLTKELEEETDRAKTLELLDRIKSILDALEKLKAR